MTISDARSTWLVQRVTLDDALTIARKIQKGRWYLQPGDMEIILRALDAYNRLLGEAGP